MPRKEMNLGTYDGLTIRLVVEDDNIPVGTNTVPGVITLRNDNPHPVTEVEGQFNSNLNIMPSNFSFARINPRTSKNVHILLNVPQSSKPGKYEINVDLDFKIDTPPATSNAFVVEVTQPTD
jgi:hypothetical protein